MSFDSSQSPSLSQWMHDAVAAHLAGRFADAERLYRLILNSDVRHPDANHNLGVLLRQRQPISQSFAYFAQAIESNPQSIQYWLSYYDALIANGERVRGESLIAESKARGVPFDLKQILAERAHATAGQAGKAASDPAAEVVQPLVALFQRREFLELEREARSLCHEYPRSGIVWKLLAAALKELGKIDEGVQANIKACELAPNDTEALYNLGLIQHERGFYREAEVALRQAIALQSTFAEAHSSLGLTLQTLGRQDEAEAAYRKALQLSPEMPNTYNNLGKLLRDKGRLDDCIAAYRRAAELNPASIVIFNNLADVLYLAGKIDEAVSAYQQAIDLSRRMDPASNAFDTAAAHVGWSAAIGNLVPTWHVPMMNDMPRNGAYFAALERVVTPETRALEIGTGSGLLSMFTARQGAAEVVTCEAVPRIAATAKAIVAENQWSHRVRVIAKKSNDLQLGVDLPRRANLLVSEVFSSELLGEGVLPSIEDAKRRLLEPTARIIPEVGMVMIALVGGEPLRCQMQVDEVHGFKLSRFNEIVPLKLVKHRDDLEIDYLSEDVAVFTFDFVRDDYFPAETKTISIRAERDGRCHGIIQWIRLRMVDDLYFENHPAVASLASGWQHCLYRFPQSIDLRAGQVLTLRATHNRNIIWFSEIA